MAQFNIFQTGKLSDKAVLDFFDNLNSIYKFNIDICYFGDKNITLSEARNLKLNKNSKSLDRYNANDGKGSVVYYYRDVTRDKSHPVDSSFRQTNPFLDEFIVQVGNGIDAETYVEITKLIEKYQVLDLPKSVDDGANSAIELLQAQLASVTDMHTNMMSDAQKQRQENETLHTQRMEELEKSAIKKQEAFEQKALLEREEIAKLQSELDAALKEVDDRDHMHVRRQLRTDITDSIVKQTSTALISQQSLIVFMFALFIALIAGILATQGFTTFDKLMDQYSIVENNLKNETVIGNQKPNLNLDQIFWLLVGAGTRAVISSIVCLGFLTYCLSWLRRNYLTDEANKRELQRYALDINRASWTIETIMEMTNKEGRVLPDRWIEGACYGLFQNTSNENKEVTPLEALGSLLQVTGKAKVGPEGTELEFNKRDLNKAAKSGNT